VRVALKFFNVIALHKFTFYLRICLGLLNCHVHNSSCAGNLCRGCTTAGVTTSLTTRMVICYIVDVAGRRYSGLDNILRSLGRI